MLRTLALLIALPCLAHPATHNITATNFAYSSRTLTVAVGDTVQWSGLGSGHNVAQSNGPADTAYNGTGFFSGSPLSGVPSFSFTFNSAGAFYYVCDFHAGTDMKGLVIVLAPTPTPSPCPTPTTSPSPSASPTPSPSPTLTATPNPAISPSHSPTSSETFTLSPTPSASPSACPTPTPSPSLSPSPLLSPTPTPTLQVLSGIGIDDARLLASPITDSRLRVWARLLGAADGAELRVYSAAGTLLLAQGLGPQAPGTARWTLALDGLPPQPIWVQLRVSADGRWRRGPVLRSYVLR